MREVEKLIEKIQTVRLEPYHYLFYIDTLFRWLEHIGVVKPTIVEAPLSVSAGEKGYVDLWLPPNIACIERNFELHFPTSKGLRYGWMVDSTTDFTVPMHYFIPNKGSYVEESIFGHYWIKYYFLRFHYEAIDSGQIIIRAWARLISHDDLKTLFELTKPLAEMFGVRYPPQREKPHVTSSELIKECPICGAKLYRLSDGKLLRKVNWGISYTDHDCLVMR
ncbi:MAG: hypothetical protein NDP16_05845 [Crenarchaeota archaeon]|nr:hypothetical protein [Thermoproteota archaeon]